MEYKPTGEFGALLGWPVVGTATLAFTAVLNAMSNGGMAAALATGVLVLACVLALWTGLNLRAAQLCLMAGIPVRGQVARLDKLLERLRLAEFCYLLMWIMSYQDLDGLDGGHALARASFVGLLSWAAVRASRLAFARSRFGVAAMEVRE